MVGRHPIDRIRSALAGTGSARVCLRVEPFRIQVLMSPCPKVAGDRVVVDSFHGQELRWFRVADPSLCDRAPRMEMATRRGIDWIRNLTLRK